MGGQDKGCWAAEAAWNTSHEALIRIERLEGQMGELAGMIHALRRDLGLGHHAPAAEASSSAPEAEAEPIRMVI